MSDVVTPIRSGGATPPATPPNKPRSPVRVFLKLTRSKEGEGFTTLDAVNGLQGVCRAIDMAAVDDGCRDIEFVGRLAQAAKVLSDMVAERVEVP